MLFLGSLSGVGGADRPAHVEGPHLDGQVLRSLSLWVQRPFGVHAVPPKGHENQRTLP